MNSNPAPLQQPSSPGATRAAGVLTAAMAGPAYSNKTYSDNSQLSTQHSHPMYSTYASNPLPSPSSVAYPHTHTHPNVQQQQEHVQMQNGTTNSSSTYQQPTYSHSQPGFSPTVFEKPLEPSPHHALQLLPPPQPAAGASSSRHPALYHQVQLKEIASSAPVAAPPSASLPSSSSEKSQEQIADNATTASTSEPKKLRSPKNASKTKNGDTPAETLPAAGAASCSTSTPAAERSSASAKKKPTRRYNASCDACRARKRKCPGRDPVTGKTLCTACADGGVQCTYGNLGEPTRLRRADTENEKLRTIINHALQAETAEEKDDILATITEKMLAASSGGAGKSRRSSEIPDDSSLIPAKRFKEDKEDVDAPSSPVSTAPPPPGETANHKPAHSSLLATAQADSRHLLGVPSPRPSSDDETTAQFTQALITSEQDRGRGDSELERHVSYFLSIAMPGGDMQDAPSPPDDHRLLEFYFSWLNPRYALLSRKLFEQSRHLDDGVYCTPFLLWALYAHSSTHCPGFEKHQAYFRARAHLLLTKELCKGKAATLPLAQGLILLAGTAAARSDHSLAWTLSFTVTGMVIDLLETMDHTITENEKMMRKRLYWSHYVWALVLALALNRKPCVPKLKVELPSGGDEADLWRAALPVRSIDEPSPTLSLPRPGHELECFREICRLFSFLDDILSNVYVAAHDKRSPETINAAVQSIQERMSTWQSSDLSSNILLNTQELPALCPPPHIIHFNLLLRAIWILLYRPFYNMSSRSKSPVKGARQACNQCASEIYAIFLYLEENFGVLQLHFSYIYAAYWAATIDVASAKREGLNPELLARLRNSSRILLTWVSLPGMKQSVSDLIEQIEALLLADVPPQVPHNEVFSAYDPLHHPHATQEGMPPNGSDAYYAQMTGLMRPQQAYMLSDPMMGVSPPVDYGPLGGLYWDVSAVPLW